jgi:hypothetical protein
VAVFCIASSNLCFAATTPFLSWSSGVTGTDGAWPGWTYKDDNRAGKCGFEYDAWNVEIDGDDYPEMFVMNSLNSASSMYLDTSMSPPHQADGTPSLRIYDSTKERFGCWMHHAALSHISHFVSENTDRMTFWVYLEGTEQVNGPDYDAISRAGMLHVGTYLCKNSDPCIDEEGNGHWYHYLNINPGGWCKVQLDRHPIHRRDSAKTPENISNNPWDYPDFSGESNYFQHMIQWYLQTGHDSWESPASIWVADVQFEDSGILDGSGVSENDESICNVTLAYYGGVSDYWEVGWYDISLYDDIGGTCNTTFVVKYSDSPITNANWDSAITIIPSYYAVDLTGSSGVRRASPSWPEAWTRFHLPDSYEEPGDIVYIGIKDISRTGEHVDVWPWDDGDYHDAPLDVIKTTEYNFYDVSTAGHVGKAFGGPGEIGVWQPGITGVVR